MRSCVRSLAIVLFLAVLTNTASAAESRTIKTMAGILMNLIHSPSHADRQALGQILADSTTTYPEYVVAESLLNVRHTVRAEDRQKLETLINDRSMPASITTMATILVTFIHNATESDRKKLDPLAREWRTSARR